MGFGGDIVVRDLSTGHSYEYDNYKGGAEVFFDVIRDRRTGKFSKLEVRFWNEFHHSVGVVACTEHNIEEIYHIFYKETYNIHERVCVFDLNEYNHPSLQGVNFVTLRIYTKFPAWYGM